MFRIAELLRPESISEAAEMLQTYPDVTVLGGCGFLKMSNRTIPRALDLSKCKLDLIEQSPGTVRIGAMVSLREMETYPLFRSSFNGALSQAIGNILGVQFRRCATIGASVYSKYGFSDILPVLLVLNTEVELLRQGKMKLIDFLEQPIQKDILLHIRIGMEPIVVSYQNLRNAQSDFPLLNAAVGRWGKHWHIAVGARPARARLSQKGVSWLKDSSLQLDDIEKAAILVAEEMEFGSNQKASAEYRDQVAKVLVKRGIMEVMSCG